MNDRRRVPSLLSVELGLAHWVPLRARKIVQTIPVVPIVHTCRRKHRQIIWPQNSLELFVSIGGISAHILPSSSRPVSFCLVRSRLRSFVFSQIAWHLHKKLLRIRGNLHNPKNNSIRDIKQNQHQRFVDAKAPVLWKVYQDLIIL